MSGQVGVCNNICYSCSPASPHILHPERLPAAPPDSIPLATDLCCADMLPSLCRCWMAMSVQSANAAPWPPTSLTLAPTPCLGVGRIEREKGGDGLLSEHLFLCGPA